MSVSFDFSGKRVVVTGGTRGVGKAIVAKFANAGATVFALGRDKTKLEQLKEEFPKGNVIPVEVDLLDWNGTKEIVEGLAPIHHLINNAGVLEPQYFKDITPEVIDRTFGVNFKGIVNVSQAMAKGLQEKGIKEGTIVNISSVLDGKAVKGAGVYNCTKAADSMLTKVMANELAEGGIRVNCVRPTVMNTELLPQNETGINRDVSQEVVRLCLGRQLSKRLCTVDECADAALYLSSSASSMVNGSDILVDGGLYVS